MITIPESVEVKRSKATEGRLMAKARERIEGDERTPGIHASDLLDLRQAYWGKVDPRPLSDRLVTMFLVGKVLHAFVISVATDTPTDLAVSDAGSRVSAELGISFSPDLELGGIVREVKTTRSYHDDVTPFYVEQLLVYLAATNTTRGKLWVLFLNLRGEDRATEPQFRCYTVTLSAEDLLLVKDEVVDKRIQLESAIAEGNHTTLPLCRDFKCGHGKCDWFDQCQPEGRWGESKWDSRLRKARG